MTRRTGVWMPLYIDDWDADTSRLSPAEDGAYGRLVRDYWRNGAPPDDDAVLARIVRVERSEWKALRKVLVGFFTVVDGAWLHKRVEVERERAQAVSEARSRAGAKGGRPAKQRESKPEANGSANGIQTHEQTETQSQSHRLTPNPARIGADENTGFSELGMGGRA